MKGVEAYPLHWPDGWPRTRRSERSRFQTTFAIARNALFNEIHRMGGRYATLSTNVPLRRDGLPYSGRKEPDDRGVAVYFQYGDKSMVFACDRWDLVQDNIQAVRKTIEAIRGIERWAEVLTVAPHLEPAVCRMADWMAHRVDRLRLCGNGVHPLAAAYAYRTLQAALDMR